MEDGEGKENFLEVVGMAPTKGIYSIYIHLIESLQRAWSDHLRQLYRHLHAPSCKVLGEILHWNRSNPESKLFMDRYGEIFREYKLQ